MPGDGRRSRSGRSGRRLFKVLIGLLVVAGLGAGGFRYWKHTHKAVSSLVPASSVILHRLPGTGYALRPDLPGLNGPSTLVKAAADDGAKDAVSALAQDGYLNGYRQLWTNPADTQKVSVALYQFRTAAGATAYSQRLVAAALIAVNPPPARFAVPEVTGAVGLGGTGAASHAAEIVFTRGPYLVKIAADNGTAPGAAPGAAREATLVAVNQYTALPAP